MQEDASQQLIDKLKVLKDQGLTYYQATQELLKQGYTPDQINAAAVSINYSGTTNKAYPDPVRPSDAKLGSAYEQVGASMLREKERNARPYAYVVLAIGCGYLGASIYRFLLDRAYWSNNGDPRYLWANNVGKYLLAGLAGALVGVIGVKLYFSYIDHKRGLK